MGLEEVVSDAARGLQREQTQLDRATEERARALEALNELITDPEKGPHLGFWVGRSFVFREPVTVHTEEAQMDPTAYRPILYPTLKEYLVYLRRKEFGTIHMGREPIRVITDILDGKRTVLGYVKRDQFRETWEFKRAAEPLEENYSAIESRWIPPDENPISEGSRGVLRIISALPNYYRELNSRKFEISRLSLHPATEIVIEEGIRGSGVAAAVEIRDKKIALHKQTNAINSGLGRQKGGKLVK